MDAAIRRLAELAERIAMGHQEDVETLLAMAGDPALPPQLAALAEAFGMLAVNVEARKFHLELLVRDLLDANLNTLEVLGAAIAKRDSDTGSHNYRVTIYSVRLAETLGLDRKMIGALIKGAFLHDTGKIAIPDAILLKPGKLDEAEFTVMMTHVQHGIDIVGRSSWLADALDVVGGHHEKWAGGGYPAGLSGEDIPVNARVFAIADVFDALTSERPYKRPFPLEKSLAILREGAGGHFDPLLIDLFEPLAPDLHARHQAMPEAALTAEVAEMRVRYFGKGG
ncbi:MAG: HD-GYP domain-containing protein [Alphaproteobacteria bacterium]|nr:HD-GYP domain-containing protein [Alphaproteobacteria bacterium]